MVEILSVDYISSIDNCSGCIVMRNRFDAQVVRLFYNQSHNLISINRLYVNPGYRNIGWGTIIMNLLIEKFKEYSFLVNAFPDDKEYMSGAELVKFYNRLGFKFLKESEEGVILIRENSE